MFDISQFTDEILSRTLPSSTTTVTSETRMEVYTSTGGNSVSSGGRVEEGESRAQVDVYSEVNGETVLDVHEVRKETGGEPAVITVEAQVVAGSSTVQIGGKAESVSASNTPIQAQARAPYFIETVFTRLSKTISYVFSFFSIR